MVKRLKFLPPPSSPIERVISEDRPRPPTVLLYYALRLRSYDCAD